MKPRPLLFLLVPLFGGAPLLQAGLQGGPEGGAQGEPDAPAPEISAPRRLERVPAPGTAPPAARASGPFDPAPWCERLALPDLDERERAFGRLVRGARRDPDARAFLEETARRTDAPELAWTARLALRELARTSPFALLDRLPQAAFDPLKLDDAVDGLLPGYEHLVPPSAQLFRFSLPAEAEGRRVSIQQNAEGWTIRIAEPTGDVQEYRGETLAEVLEAHPELQGELGISSDAAPEGFRLGLRAGSTEDLGDLLKGLASFGRFRPLVPFEWRVGSERHDLHFFFEPRVESRPYRTDVLGVRTEALGAERAAELGLEEGGLYVVQTAPGTIAYLAGIGAGDVLVRIDGRLLRRPADITAAMLARRATGELALEWIDTLGERHSREWHPRDAGAPVPAGPAEPADPAESSAPPDRPAPAGD